MSCYPERRPDKKPRTPSMALSGGLLLLFAMGLLSGCGGAGPGQEGGGGGSGGSGTVRGTAVDTQSRPLAGAKVDVCSSVFYDSCVSRTTGSDGSYSLSLPPPNSWRADGSISRSYDGKTFCLPLAIDNTDSFASTDATVRNFSWKLSGLIPGSSPNGYASSYFGGTLNVVVHFSGGDPNLVRVNFVPNGPLIDGASGSRFSAMLGSWASQAIGNIPVGVYTVSAEYVRPSGAPIPLRVSTSSAFSITDWASSASLHFTPDSSCLIAPEAVLHVDA